MRAVAFFCAKYGTNFFEKDKEDKMVYRYTCKDKTCAEKEGAAFRLDIPLEAVMDDNNMATIFCHKCGAELRMEQPPNNGENK
jgi:hypothetical protein